MNYWSQLRPLSKLDQLAETIMKTGFLLSENHHVIQSYLNHNGEHFRVINRVGESTLNPWWFSISIHQPVKCPSRGFMAYGKSSCPFRERS